ncbi:MAG: DNA-binding protein WhiA [Clostridia bacterium]|nr:DNA-binding protein WhiA [Clostridia bacterium]
MTFSSRVKKEILSSNLADGNELAMICGVILSAGTIVISNKQMSFNITSENYDLLKYVKRLIKKMFPRAEVLLPVVKGEGKRTTLSLDPESANEILFDCGILSHDELGRTNISLVGDGHLLIEREGKLAYLAGSFLGGGSISVPDSKKEHSGYHMEWSFSSSNQASAICEILATFDVFAKMVARGDNYVVYIKGSEQIGTVLVLLGASSAYLALESELVSREMRNMVNRQSNCINANIDKAVSAGIRQIEAIRQIDSTIGVENLPNSLKEIAKLRLENREATLSEIAEILHISKSAVNLRFRKLISLANELGETND